MNHSENTHNSLAPFYQSSPFLNAFPLVRRATRAFELYFGFTDFAALFLFFDAPLILVKRGVNLYHRPDLPRHTPCPPHPPSPSEKPCLWKFEYLFAPPPPRQGDPGGNCSSRKKNFAIIDFGPVEGAELRMHGLPARRGMI